MLSFRLLAFLTAAFLEALLTDVGQCPNVASFTLCQNANAVTRVYFVSMFKRV
jgi:hypothetical protein